jgi:signal transduction histidine kinase/ligand-binding sensor domain-containing protein/CheY-like chemotaxis protein
MNAMARRYICLSVLLCIATNLLFSQDGNIGFSHLSSRDGLPTNQVDNILQDSRGFWWIASHSGLSRYDGSNFKHFIKNDSDSTSLLSNQVYALYEDPKTRLWVMTADGMCVFDPGSDRFIRDITPIFEEFQIPVGTFLQVLTDTAKNFWMLHSQGLYKYDPVTRKTSCIEGFGAKNIARICEGNHGDIWIICYNGIFARINKNLEIDYVNDELTGKHIYEEFRIKADPDGDLWIYTETASSGIIFFDSRSNSIRPINTKSPGVRLNSDIVRDVEVGENSWVWVCTDHGGINLINKKTWKQKYLTHDPLDQGSVSGNAASFIYKDNENTIWIGVYRHGLSYYHKDLNKFTRYQNSALDPASLPFNDINRFAEDRNGNLWIGTNGGGLVYFDRRNKLFRQYLHDPKDASSLSSNVIVSLSVDRFNHLWVGTYFGGLDYFDGNRFVHFKHTNKENEISDNSIWDVKEDSEGNVWIGTLLASLNKYDPRTNKFFHYGREHGIHSGYITSVLEDVDGSIWVGTGYGVSMLKKGATKFLHFQAGNGKGSVTNNQITCMYADKDNADLVWIGTQDGLNVFDRKSKSFRHIKTGNGLPGNDIMGVVLDDHGKVWITTAKGVSVLTIKNIHSPNDSLVVSAATFDEADGLQSKQFNPGAILKTTDGHLFFGSTNGFNELTPSPVEEPQPVPRVIFSKLLIDNNEVKAGQEVNGHVILTKSVTETDKISLSPGYNSFALEFSILTLIKNSKIRSRYKLAGFDNDWIESNPQGRSAHYTSIDAGTYKLVLSIATADGVWHDGVEALEITVLPPIWRSNVAVLIYIVISIFIAFFARRFLLMHERARYEIEKAQEERQRAREIDRLKIKFITNVSHEFRTPLSLIITPIQSLLKHSEQNVVIAKDHLRLIHRNAKRLLNLVNQLLDFRRLELEEVSLNASEGDIVGFIKDVAGSFADLAEGRRITFSIESKVPEITMLFDPNKIERILFNLISNGFKFTPEGGKVTVEIWCEENADGKVLRIDVKDTGIGIASGYLDKIFDRFFQADLPSDNTNEGSGIGLSITREFVALHGGEISVTSEVSKGSCFSIVLPVRRQVGGDSGIDVDETPPQSQGLPDAIQRQGKRILLLVEDNEDFRFYLKDNFKYRYQVEEARNGAEGWKKAVELLPDMVVSDIRMPETTGIELCTRIRHDKRTSHIPVILLTARSSEDQRLEGLHAGADDYIVKPFNFEFLQARIQNLISLRAKFHQKFQQNFEIHTSEINISSLDQILMERAIKIVEAHMSDPDFSVEELCSELGISRAHLYRKLLSLTGKSANRVYSGN